MTTVEEIKTFLLERRNKELIESFEKEDKEEGYVDINSRSGGGYGSAFGMGQEMGEAELIEELLAKLS